MKESTKIVLIADDDLDDLEPCAAIHTVSSLDNLTPSEWKKILFPNRDTLSSTIYEKGYLHTLSL